MSDKPIAACFLPTFLAPEMLHVYRQITGLKQFTPHVLTQKRSESRRYPFPEDRLTLLDGPSKIQRELQRFWKRRIQPGPKILSKAETAAVREFLGRNRASVLHVYFGNAGTQFLPVFRVQPRPCPMVVSFHGADAGVSLGQPAWQEAIKEVFREADAILARSNALANDLEKLGCPVDKLTVQRAGIPLEEWEFVERQFPSDRACKLVQSGRLIEKKGYDLTLQAFAELGTEFPKAELAILGDGPLRSELEKMASELKIADRVTFHGFLDQNELKEVYESAHLFLHPSRTSANGDREGVPNAMLEAMATGLPVIATWHGGIPEAVPAEWLAPENDADSLAKLIRQTLENPDEWTKRSRLARAQVETNFEQRQQIAVLEGVYRKVMSGY